MAMTLAELEQQDVEFLPAREVMTTCSRSKKCGSTTVINNGNAGNSYESYGSINVLSGNNVAFLNGNVLL